MSLGPRVAVGTISAAFACAFACSDGSQPATPVGDAGTATPPPSVAQCTDGSPTLEWPVGPHEIALTGTLPPHLEWPSDRDAVRIRDYYDPCAKRPRLLVVRSSAAWCGPCAWHAANAPRAWQDPRVAGRVALLDLLIADEDNMPATESALARWKAKINAGSVVEARAALDPRYSLASVLPSKSVLPEYVVIDTRTMVVKTVLANPNMETLAGFLATEIAALDGTPRPDLRSPTRHDNLLTDDQFEQLKGMRWSAKPPSDPTNAVVDSPAAAALGKALFQDVSLSPSGAVSCATCHDASQSFADGLPQAKGTTVGDRNSPSVALAAHARSQFWDGRADTLWAQALGPFENPKEFNSTRVFVVRAIIEKYASAYQNVFGITPPLPDTRDLPATGKPTEPAYDALSPATRDAVTRIFVNAGKAIAAFESSLQVKPNALDRYIDGDTTALTAAQKRGLSTFFSVGCATCHWGPRLTDDAFHAVGFPTGRQDQRADVGRADVLLGLANREFSAQSQWSDTVIALPGAPSAVPASMAGAFKTPALRGVASTAPYGHGGTFASLAEVARHYGERGKNNPQGASAGTIEEWLPAFDSEAQTRLVDVLEILTAEVSP
jgi:cytochrome c peroxidase